MRKKKKPKCLEKLKQFKRTEYLERERSSSEKERKVNALASGAEEGRDKLR